VNDVTNRRFKANTLALGLALAVGSLLIAPATAAVAVPMATCPDETLTETQLNHLIVDINVATLAEAATGYRATNKGAWGDYVGSRSVVTKDVAHDRFDEDLDYGPTGGAFHYRSLANGFDYTFTSTEDGENKPALDVLGRTDGWVNTGEHEEGFWETRPLLLNLAPVGGTCEQGDAGLTLAYGDDVDEEDDGTGIGRHTIVTNSSLAATSAIHVYGTPEDGLTDTTTIAYGQFDVEDIPFGERISPSNWRKARKSAAQRSALTGYAKKVATVAKAAATRAKRPVRATDVKAVKLTPPSGTTRSLVKTGIAVAATDAYTGKTLRITVTVAQQTLRIGDNW
jgi:hypothetical protein